MNIQYEELQVKELLAQLGKGKGMTGAVGAAALAALMGAELLVSVCKITEEKNEGRPIVAQLNNIESMLSEKHIPKLKKLMQQDVDAVSALIKEQHITKALTTTPLSICRECRDIVDSSLILFDIGYKVMKGDTATAIALILSVVQSTLFVAMNNIKVEKDNHLREAQEAELGQLRLAYNKLYQDAMTHIYP